MKRLIILILLLTIFLIGCKKCCMCGDTSSINSCCPCPNLEIRDRIIEVCGYTPSSAGSWKWCCDDYNKVNPNNTVECWDE